MQNSQEQHCRYPKAEKPRQKDMLSRVSLADFNIKLAFGRKKKARGEVLKKTQLLPMAENWAWCFHCQQQLYKILGKPQENVLYSDVLSTSSFEIEYNLFKYYCIDSLSFHAPICEPTSLFPSLPPPCLCSTL